MTTLRLLWTFFRVGVIGLIIQPSIQRLIESVRDGTLDFTLTKPEEAQLLVSVQQIDIWEALDVLLGLGTLGVAVARLGESVGPAQAAVFGAMLLAGGVIVYSFWLILATLSFWFLRVENILVIFQSVCEAGRWPASIYPAWPRFGLTLIVPVAFVATVPAQALTGRLDWPASWPPPSVLTPTPAPGTSRRSGASVVRSKRWGRSPAAGEPSVGSNPRIRQTPPGPCPG